MNKLLNNLEHQIDDDSFMNVSLTKLNGYEKIIKNIQDKIMTRRIIKELVNDGIDNAFIKHIQSIKHSEETDDTGCTTEEWNIEMNHPNAQINMFYIESARGCVYLDSGLNITAKVESQLEGSEIKEFKKFKKIMYDSLLDYTDKASLSDEISESESI